MRLQMFSVKSAEDACDSWFLEEGTLKPRAGSTAAYAAAYQNHASDDGLIDFHFPPYLQESCCTTFRSRLLESGGPLAALLNDAFRESRESKVALSSEDDPDTFRILFKFVNCEQIALRDKTPRKLFQVVRSAHRWQLVTLMNQICLFICEKRFFDNATNILQAVDIVSLPGIPNKFISSFWRGTALRFDEFSGSSSLKATDWIEDVSDETCYAEEQPLYFQDSQAGAEMHRNSPQVLFRYAGSHLCPGFPNMWELAIEISSNRLFILICDVARLSSYNLNGKLLHMVLSELEPLISDDKHLLNAVSFLVEDESACSGCSSVFSDPRLFEKVSPRAEQMLNLALSSMSPHSCEQNYLFSISFCNDSWEAKDILYDLPQHERKGTQTGGFVEKIWFFIRLKRISVHSFTLELVGQVGSKLVAEKLDSILLLSLSIVDNGNTCKCERKCADSDQSRTLHRLTYRHSLRSQKFRVREQMLDAITERYGRQHGADGQCCAVMQLRVRVGNDPHPISA